MGIASSTSNSSEQHTSADLDESNEHECSLPDNVLVEILSYVPALDLLRNCSRVCIKWRDFVYAHGVWKRKCIREGRTLPPFTLKEIPKHFYRLVYLKNPFGRNLLKNPSGEEEIKFWEVEDNGGDGWKVENPPAGCDEIPKEAGSNSCFATSYQKCLKYQHIDLYQEGINREIFEAVRPVIDFGEWHSSRFDCGSVYEASILLLDEEQYELYRFETGPLTEPQWTGHAWTKISHRIDSCPSTVRFIIFDHSGQDTQFWAGHYGSKMTGAYVKLLFK